MNMQLPSSEAKAKLFEEAKQRNLEYSNLTISLSLGAVMFLIGFTENITKNGEVGLFFIDSSWFCFYGAIVTGLGLRFYETLKPYLRWQDRQRSRTVIDGRMVEVSVISGSVRPVEHICFWSHQGFLLLGLLSLAIYKGLN